MKFLIAAAGTGGHVFPALEFTSECLEQNHEVVWIGTKNGIEKDKVLAKQVLFFTLPMSGFRGKGLITKLISVLGLAVSIFKAIIFILQNKVNCVVCFGGYISLPVGLAAIICRKQLILHEQNAVIGTSNKLLTNFANIVFLGMPLTTSHKKNMQVVGNPISKKIKNDEPTQSLDRPLRVYVTGGSLGSEFINKNIPPALSSLKIPIIIRHQSGENKSNGIKSLYSSDISVDVQEFYDAPSENILWSDFVICRAGALTLSEVTSLKRGCIMIPLPLAIDNHQLENAKQIENLNLGLIFEESESLSSLIEKLQTIIGQKKFIAWQNAQDSIDHFKAAETMLSSVLAITK